MNERKPEEAKKAFNSLSMKLVKPPEKKPTDKKPEPATNAALKVNAPAAKAHKPAGKVDIMDLDFLSFDQPKVEEPVKQANTGSLNLLGAPVSQPAKPAVQSTPIQSLDLNFSLSTATEPAKPQTAYIQPASQQNSSNFLYNNNFNAFNYAQPTQPQQNGSFSFSTTPQPQHNIPISLAPQPVTSFPTQSKSQSSSSNLIDFSNFRE
jgi:hypothetical protein